MFIICFQIPNGIVCRCLVKLQNSPNLLNVMGFEWHPAFWIAVASFSLALLLQRLRVTIVKVQWVRLGYQMLLFQPAAQTMSVVCLAGLCRLPCLYRLGVFHLTLPFSFVGNHCLRRLVVLMNPVPSAWCTIHLAPPVETLEGFV